MFGGSEHTHTHSRKIMFVALVIGLGFWVSETVFCQYLFDNKSFADMLLAENVHELWMRSLVTCVIIGFGIYAQLIANRLNESRQRYQALFENAPDGIILADIESGRIVDVNPSACRLLGRQRAEVLGLHQSQLHPPEMAEHSKRLFEDHLRRIGRGGSTLPVEHLLVRSDGTRVPVEIAAQTVTIEGKSVLQGIFRDVAERKKAEELLRGSEEKYRTLFEHAGDYILVLEIPPAGDPIIRDANASALRVHGYAREELVGSPITLVDTETVDPAVAQERLRRLLSNETLNFEVQHRRKDGTVFDAEISARAVKLGSSLLVISIERDITERKKAEDAIRRQTKLLESIRHAQSLFIAADDPKPVFDSLLETLVTITDSEYGFLDEVRGDEDGIVYKKSLAISDISWNEESRQLYEQLETSNMEFRNMSNLAGAPAAAGKLIISNKPAGDPLSGGLPEGHPVLSSYMGIPVFFAGELVGVAGVANRPGGYNDQMAAFLETFIATCGAIIHAVRNERNKLQITSALKQSEERYRQVVEDQTEFLVRWLPDGTRTFVNDSYCRYFGITHEAAIGTSFLPLISEDYREAVTSRVASVTPEAPLSTGEHQVTRPDGTTGWTQWTDRAIFNDEGELVAFQSVGRDVTERKLAEDALRESEKRNFALFDDAAVAVWEEDFSQVKECFDQLRSCGVSDFREYFDRHPDEVKRCAGMVRVLNVNKVSVAMLKAASKEELLVNLPDYFDSEQAWAVFREELAVLAEGQTHFQSEIPIRCQNGEELILDLRLSVLSGYETSLERVYVSFIDITARKHAEYQLAKSEENYRDLYENAPLGYQSLDSAGDFLDVNKEWLRTLGYSKEEVIGRCFSEFLAPEFELSFAQKFPKFKAAGKMRGNEFEMLRKDGSRIITSFAGNIEYDAEGNFRRTHCIMHDITERRRAEEKLRQESVMRETLLDNLPCVAMILKKGTREIVASNEAARKSGAVPGKTCYETCAERGESCPFCLAQELWTDDKPRRKEVESRGRHFERIWVPLTDELYVHYIFDVTERKQAEQALLESENKYRAVVENAGEGIVVAQDGVVRFVNPRFTAITGYSQDELMGRPFIDFVHPDDRDHMADIHSRRLAGEDLPRAYELRIIDKHGDTRWLENNGILIEWGGRLAALNFLRDVTDRKKAEESLRESEERFRGIFENSLVGLYRTTPDGRIIMANEALARMLRYPSVEKLMELDLEKDGFERPQDRPAFMKLIEEMEQVVGQESSWKRSDGTTLYVRESSRVIRDDNGNVLYYEGTVEDITDRKQAEKRLLEDRAQLKSLASQLSLTEERERRRLATDLHDQIGQSLVLSKIKLDLLRQSAAAGELTGALEEVCTYLAQVIQDTRTLTFDLSSPILYEMGIEAAIAEWLNDEIKTKHGIATEFYDDQQDKPLEDDIRTMLFRNVRELLINVVKHADAGTVKVSIARAGEQVNICVEDDGVGFDPEEERAKAAKKAKFGLFSIRERLEQLGGQISIDSSPGNGSRITMTAPLKKADTAAWLYGI